MNFSRYKNTIFIFVLFLLTFIIKMLLLHQSDLACGIDGYYYGVQVKYLKLEGALRIPESSPVLYIITFISFLFSSPINAIKFSASLLSASIVIPAYLLGKETSEIIRKDGNDHSQDGIFLAILFSLSVSITYMTVEYIKNLGAVMFFLWYLYFFIRLLKDNIKKPSLFYVIMFILSGTLAFFSHRTGSIAVLFMGAAFLSVFRINKRFLLISIFGLSLFFIAVILLKKTGVISGGLHISDLQRFHGVFNSGVNIPLFSKSLYHVMKGVLWFEISIYYFIPLISLAALIYHKKYNSVIFILNIFLILLFHPFWSLEKMGMGFRIFLFASALVPVLILVLSIFVQESSFFERLKERIKFQRTLYKPVEILQKKVLFLPLLLLIVTAVIQYISTHALYNPRNDPKYHYYKKLISRFSLPEKSLLICHKGFNLLYTYETGLDGLNFIPEYKMPVDKLWRLSYYVDYEKYEKYIPRDVKKGYVKKLQFPYHLIREDAWERFFRVIPDYLQISYRNFRNPHKKRPAFLRVHHSFNKKK